MTWCAEYWESPTCFAEFICQPLPTKFSKIALELAKLYLLDILGSGPYAKMAGTDVFNTSRFNDVFIFFVFF